MTQTRIHRFDFGGLRDFRGPIIMKSANEAEQLEAVPIVPAAPVFSEQDIENAQAAGRKQGYGEGFAAGQLEAQRAVDAKIEEANNVILALGEKINSLGDAYRNMIASESTNLTQLVTAIARKVAGEAIDARGVDTIAAIVDRALPVMFNKPRVTIELSPEVIDFASARLESQLRAQGFEGEMVFRGNPNLGMSDVNLDWGSGQANRSARDLWNEIEALIERVPLEMTFEETLTTHNT